MTNTVPPLTQRLAEIVEYIQAARVELENFVQSVPDALSQQRPAPDRWSVADNLEHLALIEDGCGRMISNIVKQVRAEGSPPEPDSSSLLDCLDQYQIPSATRTVPAPDRVQPTSNVPVQLSMQNLRQARARLLQAVHDASGLDLTRGSVPHPLFGPFNGYQWLLLLGQHERRHMRQMQAALHDLTQ